MTTRWHPAEIIQRKRDGHALEPAMIREFIAGVVAPNHADRVGDAQLGAFLMAICCRGMNTEETAELTLAMRDSGTVLDLSSVPGPQIDKHSTGGVGDKVSLVLAPLVAAAGVSVPMISGRGLGHTGGTLDKLAAIPGYRTDWSTTEFVEVLRDCGYVISGPSADLAPADARMYAVRDVSGTVENVALIISSILAKKLASGLDGLVMDVKVGRAAFMKSEADARELMASLVRVGQQAGKRVRALLTDMDRPLGRAIGNALEVRETIETLKGHGPADLLEVTYALGGEMLVMAGRCASAEEGEALLAEVLASGRALEKFHENLVRQGGDPAVIDGLDRLPTAPVVADVVVDRTGYVQDLDPLAIGKAVVALGGGRRQPEDDVDLSVGVCLERCVGDRVDAGATWARVHAANDAAAEQARARLEAAIVVAADPVAVPPVVLARM